MAAPVQYPKENEGSAILGATLTVTIVALITFITRLYVRLRMIRNVGWDVSRSADRSYFLRTHIWLGLHHGDGHVASKCTNSVASHSPLTRF
jgi:hypothetical protein